MSGRVPFARWLAAAALFAASSAHAACPGGADRTATTMARTAKNAYDSGDYAKAAHLYFVAYGTCPRGDWLYSAGRAAHVAGNLDKAMEHYSAYLTADDREPALAEKAKSYLVVVRESRADELAVVAQKAAASGDHAVAAATWSAICRLQPARAEFWFKAGVEAQAAGLRDDAISALRMYMDRAPLDALERTSARDRLRQLGIYVALSGNPESADAEAARLNPTQGTTSMQVEMDPSAAPKLRFQSGRFFVDTEAATVTDEAGGVVWQRDVASVGARSFDEAKSYCERLNGGGQGWRLPSFVELRGLVDTTQTPARIDAKAFPGTPPATFWSTTPAPGPELGAFWRVNFATGGPGQARSSELLRVRCVRILTARASTNVTGNRRFQVEAKAGTVYDARTRLTWQRDGVAGGQRNWLEAGAYCASLDLAGRGWRVPSLDELKSIVDDDKLNPAIDKEIFPDTPANGYWTSTPYRYPISDAWFVDFRDGSGSVFRSVDAQLRVRCVR